MTVERIPITSRQQWLDLRANDITASDVAAMFGLSPYKTSLRLYYEKRREISETGETKAMRRGRWLELGVLTALAEERPDWQIEQPHLYLRDPENRLGATPDAIAYDRADSLAEIIVQCKVVSRPIFDAGWQDGPPIAYRLQTLTETMLWGAPRAVIAVLIIDTYSAELEIFPVERHAPAEKRIRDAVACFWADIEETRAPTVDYSRDGDLIQILYPPRKELEPIDLNGDNFLPELLAERERLMIDEKSAKARLDEIRGELVHKLNGAPAAICDGWKITHSLTHRKEHIVPANSYPVLRVTKAKEKTA